MSSLSLSILLSKSLIFLGAGASVPFGIPTMNEFTDRVAESLSGINKEWENRVLEIKSTLQTKGLRYDIEILSTALSIFSDPSLYRTYLTPFFAFSEYPVPQGNHSLAGILKEVKKEIYRVCKRYNRSDANKIYQGLFDSLYSVDLTKINADGNLERFSYPVNYEVFTTNYDLSFSKFLEYQRKDYADGFSGADRGGISIFTNNWFTDHSKPDTMKFGKLHGSINYYKHEDGRIVKYPISLDEEDMSNEGIIDNMMIYPIGEKYATITPYFEILAKFRNTLINEKVVIVIGYSFRDDAINKAFIDRVLRHKTNFKIVLVDPNVDENKKDLPPVLQPWVTTIKAKFDSKNCPDLIVSAIQDRHPGDA
jgi:hypothetical protein